MSDYKNPDSMPSMGWQIFSALLLVAVIGGGIFLAWRYLPGCKNPIGSLTASSSNVNGATPSLASPPSSPLNENETLRIHGSNTLAARLVPELVRAYFKAQGGTHVQEIKTDQSLTIRGDLNGQAQAFVIQPTGSHQGFVDAQQRKADVVMASRPIADNEFADLQNAGLGDMRNKRAETVVAMDGVAVIVNSQNRAKDLSKTQIAEVFRGNITNWAELGFASAPINLYVRDAGSTVDMFKMEMFGNEQEAFTSAARSFRDNDELIQQIANDPNGLGFTSWAATKGHGEVKSLALHSDATQPISPNASSIATEDYQLSRRLYLYTPPATDGAKQGLLDKLMAFILSAKGQEAAQRAGFVPLDPQGVNAVTTPISDKYRNAVRGGIRTNVVLRFKTGSSELDSKALRDLERLKTDPRYQGKRFVLAGFTDNIGSEPANIALSLKRAQAVQQLMQQNGLNVEVATGLGSSDPVRENSTAFYRAMNRRVDVWYK